MVYIAGGDNHSTKSFSLCWAGAGAQLIRKLVKTIPYFKVKFLLYDLLQCASNA